MQSYHFSLFSLKLDLHDADALAVREDGRPPTTNSPYYLYWYYDLFMLLLLLLLLLLLY